MSLKNNLPFSTINKVNKEDLKEESEQKKKYLVGVKIKDMTALLLAGFKYPIIFCSHKSQYKNYQEEYTQSLFYI